MVNGIDKFREYFAEFKENYLIIGGAACYYYESNVPTMNPRKTKDIDMILVVEALTPEFVKRFWEFIRDGKYSNNATGRARRSGRHTQFYRFNKPENEEFPKQIELFSRTCNLMTPEDPNIKIIHIDAVETLYSLSAILMSYDYYTYVLEHSIIDESGIHLASEDSLICMKCKAFLEMTKQKEAGENIDMDDIKKHRNDVFRIISILPEKEYEIPIELKKDVVSFYNMNVNDLPDDSFFKSLKLPVRGSNIGKQLMDKLKKCFKL